MIHKHAISLADAIQAFLQAPLLEETWVILGEELWLPHWFDMYPKGTKLCVKLCKSLYGHPLAGKLWQNYLNEKLAALNAVEIEGFPSNYLIQYGSKLLLLDVYVDDLTLSGDESLHQQFWNDLRRYINIEPEVFINKEGSRILGRGHCVTRGVKTSTMHFDMRPYALQTVEFYCELCGLEIRSLKTVTSPALPESAMSDEESVEQGELSGYAAQVLMRLLWLSRLSRPDLAFIVGRLASNVSRWSRWDDRQLLRVISYLNCTIDFVTVGTVSHGFDPQILVFTDADFASCPWTSKSTSGIFIAIATGESLFPIFWQSKKQSSVARSTSESELIAMSTALFGETLQVQDMLTYLLGKRPDVILKQDNEAVIKIVRNRFSVKLRHCGRVHRVNVSSVSSLVEETDQCISLEYCNTQLQLANPLTKILSPQSWAEALRQLCVQPFKNT